MKTTWKDTLRRALRTFVQTAAGYIAVNLTTVGVGGGVEWSVVKNALVGLGVSAFAAGCAAVMNLPHDYAEGGQGDE